MRDISSTTIQQAVKDLFMHIPFVYPQSVKEKLSHACEQEEDRAKSVLELLLENEQLAKEEHIPLCQDTGMAIVLVKIGQDVHVVGDLNQAIHDGVREAYQQAYLRYSVVDDPLFERKNTGDNTPALIHYEIIQGDNMTISVMAKGFGSENCSKLMMLKPAQGIQGVKDFVVDVVKQAGPNACPPMSVGVGIGGTMDHAAWLAKKALLRTNEHHPDKRYAQLEKDVLEDINALNIGPAGLKGKTTAISVAVEYSPTHIAGLPVAININCHAVRKAEVVL